MNQNVDIFNLNVKTLNLKLPKDVFFRVKSISEVDKLASLLEESVINPLDGSLISFHKSSNSDKVWSKYADYRVDIGNLSIFLYSGNSFMYYFEGSVYEVEKLPYDTDSTYIWLSSSDSQNKFCGLHNEIVGQIMSSLNL